LPGPAGGTWKGTSRHRELPHGRQTWDRKGTRHRSSRVVKRGQPNNGRLQAPDLEGGPGRCAGTTVDTRAAKKLGRRCEADAIVLDTPAVTGLVRWFCIAESVHVSIRPEFVSRGNGQGAAGAAGAKAAEASFRWLSALDTFRRRTREWMPRAPVVAELGGGACKYGGGRTAWFVSGARLPHGVVVGLPPVDRDLVGARDRADPGCEIVRTRAGACWAVENLRGSTTG